MKNWYSFRYLLKITQTIVIKLLVFLKGQCTAFDFYFVLFSEVHL